jgi:PAX-interacting protein 1
MFFVDLKQAPNNKEIYDITSLLRHRVKFEPPRQKRELPQCARCQHYGHTKAYCQLRPCCVKCLGDHATALCPRKEKSFALV